MMDVEPDQDSNLGPTVEERVLCPLSYRLISHHAISAVIYSGYLLSAAAEAVKFEHRDRGNPGPKDRDCKPEGRQG
eukprot:1010101-Rhodomonas_salina.1